MKRLLFITLLMLLSWDGLCLVAKRRPERSQTPDSDHKESPTSVSNGDITYTNTDTPEFLAELYRCWQERESSVESCYSPLEDRELLTSAHVIRGYMGNAYSSSSLNNEPSHSLVSFNISCSTMDEIVHSSELRIYKEGISPETLDQLSTELCNLNNGVTVILLADLGQDNTMQVVGRVALTREELLIDKWIVFYQFTSTYKDWVQYSSNRGRAAHVQLALKGACAGVSVTELGLMIDPTREPLLVAFLESSNPEIERRLYQQMIESNGEVERFKRQSSNTIGVCQKYSHTVNFKRLGWQNIIIGPTSYQANYCAGHCAYPITRNLNGTYHAQVQALTNLLYPNEVSPPCCVPTKTTPQALIVRVDSRTMELKTYPDMMATECGCR